MPENLSNNYIFQPTSQIVYNTLYTQKLLEIEEKDLNIPINEYLSKIVNLNLKAIVDSNYIEYEQNYKFINEIIKQVETNSNCLLNGFEVGVDQINNHIIDVKIYPGSAILNNFIIELYEPVILSIDTSIDLNSSKYIIVLSPSDDSYYTKEFKILYYLLDEENNIIIDLDNHDPWDNNKFLPIGLFEITGRSNDLHILSIESLGFPVDLTDQSKNPPLFNVEESLKYQLLNIPYVELFKNKTILGTKSLVPLYSPPKIYNINNYDFIIPNYGEHVNNGYFLFEKLYKQDYFISNWIKANILNFNEYFPNIF